MKAEHAVALKYIFQEEVYLLPGEKPLLNAIAGQVNVSEQVNNLVAKADATATAQAPEPIAAQPVTEAVPVIPKIEPVPAAPAEPEPIVQTPVTGFSYLGSNRKAFLIFTHYPDQDFMAPEHLTALQNILKRKEIELEDIAILNLAKTANSKWGDIYRFFAPKKVLVLGQKAVPAGLTVPALNTLKIAPAASLLYSFSFDEMMNSTDNKKAFWEQMKNL